MTRLTAHAMPEELEGILDAGCNERIVKPVRHSRLFALIERFVAHPVGSAQRVGSTEGRGR